VYSKEYSFPTFKIIKEVFIKAATVKVTSLEKEVL
jgi:hypothetical protein